MTHRHIAAFAIALIIALLPLTADAEDVSVDAEPYSHGLWLEGGLGAPNGLYGLHYHYRLDNFSLGGLVGDGISGTQVGASLRAFMPAPGVPVGSTQADLLLELSYAAGIHDDANNHQFRNGTWHWAHLGAGAAFWNLDTHLTLSITGGITTLIAGPGDGSAHIDVADVSLFEIAPLKPLGPWTRLGLGVVF